MKKNTSVRLPSYIKPERYRLMLKPDLKEFVFSGEETIYLKLEKSVKEITLHAIDLDISDVSFANSKGKKVAINAKKISFNPKNETVTFSFAKALPKGMGELSLSFKGVLSDKLTGFYRSKYTHNKKEKYLATTQFEPTDARRAFPCFDEPAAKAVFDVTFMIPSHLTAISNTIETSVVEHDGGFKTVTFSPSPKMSTYLLAYIIGEFEYIEKKTKRGVLVRVFVTHGKKKQAEFALETAARCLDYYEEYFDIHYPLPVMDLIALPDFASAAMENWGAITYRETALLFDEEHSSTSNKQWVAIVIAHEIAHQWFGNLVTMHWWTDLWLNEGFASYMEYLATDALFPEWHMWDQYVAERFSVALHLDSLATSHPIEIEVHHPSEISEIFDQVSYAKGSTVIRMLAEYLGADVFREGLRHYLKKHSYANTVTEDLWKAFEKVSKKPIRKMMQVWTQTTGYPLVHAEKTSKGLYLTQKRFFSSSVSLKKNKEKTVWKIPLCILSEDGSSKQILMEKPEVTLKDIPDGWVKLNTKETSLVRTSYAPDSIKALETALAAGQLISSDRLGLIRDAFALASSGQGRTVSALELAEFYKAETELPVWEEVAAGVFSSLDLYHNEPWFSHAQTYMQQLFVPTAESLGWVGTPGESHATGILRSVMLLHAGLSGYEPVIKQAQKLFSDYIKHKKIIPPNIRGVVYQIVAKYGSMSDCNTFIKLYESSHISHEEQDRLGRAMGQFTSPEAVKKLLAFTISDKVRTQDAPSIFISIARNSTNTEKVWEFFKENWEIIFKKYNAGGHLLEWFVRPFAKFKTKQKAVEVQTFFKKHPVKSLSRTLAQIVERIESNAALYEREKKAVGDWLISR